VDTLTPVQQINDATVNFLSTVQNVRPSDIPSIMTSIGQAAKLAQTPVEDLTKAVTTSNIAFGRANNPKNIQEFNRMWFALISTVPGGPSAAPEIANQMPALASMMALGQGRNVSGRQAQAQMLSLVIGALRTGATPATGLRGLTYLLQSIIQPTGKARGALAGIGITPRSIYEQGVYTNLIRLLDRITGNMSKRTRREIAGLSDEQLSDIEANNGTLPGISPTEMTRLRAMIPRIHGIRAAVILAGQLQQRGDVGSLAQDLVEMQKAQNDEIQGALNMAKAWQNFRKRSRLQEASVAINAMSLQVASIFEPVLNFVAGKVTSLQGVMQHHQRATRDAVIGGAAFVGAIGLGRMFGLGRLPGLNRIPGLRGLLGGSIGSRLSAVNAAQAALSGNTQIGASPQNPLYVVVVSQLFGGGTKGPSGGGGNPATDPVNDYFGYKIIRGAGRFFRKVGNVARNPRLDAIAEAIAARGGLKAIPLAGIPLSALIDAPSAGGDASYIANMHQAQRVFGNRYGEISGVQGNPVLRNFHGHAEVYLNLDITGPGGYQQRKRVHIPLKMWEGGRTPGSAGIPKTTRSG